MNWQLHGRPGIAEPPVLAQSSQELLTWGATPIQMQQDRPSTSAEQPWMPQNPSVAGDISHATATNGHAQRNRHVSWMRQGEQGSPSGDDLLEQQHDAGLQEPAALQSPVGQPPGMSAMMPLAPVMQNLQLQDSSLLALQPASGPQHVVPSEVHQPVQSTAQPQPQQPATVVVAAPLQPVPPEAPPVQQPAQAAGDSVHRAATPAVTRRWVRPKPVQQRGWNDSTQSMGTVLHRKLPPAPPRAQSSKPLYSSPLFTARSQRKLDTEQRLSTDGAPQPSPVKAPPRKQPSASRLAPPYPPQGGLPQTLGQQSHQQQQQLYQAQQPVMMTPVLPGPWGVLHLSLPGQQLTTPVPPMPMHTPALMSGNAQLQQQQSALQMPVLMPAWQSHSSAQQQLQQQQQRSLRVISHQNSPAQMQPQMQPARHSEVQAIQPQMLQGYQQLEQQPVSVQLATSQAAWTQGAGQQPSRLQGTSQQPTLPFEAPGMLQTFANGNMPPEEIRMRPGQLQPWQSQQHPGQQPPPAPPRAAKQGSARGVMYGRTVSVGGTGQQPGSRAPSTAGSARGSSTGGRHPEWNSHFTKKTTRRKTAAIEPPRPTQAYTERLKSMSQRRSRGVLDDVGGTGNDAATDAPQQHDVLPQYGVPGTLWPQQQPGPMPFQTSGIWGNVAGQMYPAQ